MIEGIYFPRYLPYQYRMICWIARTYIFKIFDNCMINSYWNDF